MVGVAAVKTKDYISSLKSLKNSIMVLRWNQERTITLVHFLWCPKGFPYSCPVPIVRALLTQIKDSTT